MTTAAKHFDLIVIGSGSAGSACWYNAAVRGKRVAVVEAGVLGGECPTSACVPTKALLQCAEVYETLVGAEQFGVSGGPPSFDYNWIKERKDDIVSQTGAALGEEPMLEMGVEVIRHHARFVSANEIEAGGERYSADNYLIATGASQVVPQIEGLAEAGYLTFKEAIDLTELPESILIMGGGAVGCEFTQLFTTFGVTVALIDRNPRLLHKEEPEVSNFLYQHFGSRQVGMLLDTTVSSVEVHEGVKLVKLQRGGQEGALTVDEILVATGKAPNLDLGLEAAGIEYNAGGILVDNTMRTTNPIVYAAGDVVGPYRFTHAASYQGGIACYNMFAGVEKRRADYSAMPRCVFTSPEVACVGLTEAEARAQGIDVRVGFAQLDMIDRALTADRLDGFVKVIADETGRLVGGAIVAPRAGEMVQELVLAISLGATALQVANTIHAFPTYSEAVSIACSEVEV